MNKSQLTLTLSLAALLGGALLLPATASAHAKGVGVHIQHSHQPRGNDWYLLRHRGARHHVYQPRVYHIHTQPAPRRHSPVRLKIVL